MRIFSLALVLLFALASCGTQNIRIKTQPVKPDRAALDSVFYFNPKYEHVIRKDDKLNVSVWGQDELSVGSIYGIYNSNEVYGKSLLVDKYGNIELPKYGTFRAEGYTIPNIKDSLRRIYGRWIVNPIVDVKVLNKQITVLGEVRNPSVVQVDKDANTLLDMIARTGGFEFYANLKSVKVLRQKDGNVHVANINLINAGDYLARNIQLQPGDIVIVPSKRYKAFDKRIATIIPFTSTVTAAAILMSTF